MWEIIDDNGVIYSGYSEEETINMFQNIKNGNDTIEWCGDLKLVQVHEIYR